MPSQTATWSIGKRIGQLVARSVFAAVTTSALLMAGIEANQEIDAKHESLKNTGYVLASATASALVAKDHVKAQETLAALSRLPNIKVVELSDMDGKTFVNFGGLSDHSPNAMAEGDGNARFLMMGTMPVSVDILQGATKVGRLNILADVSDVRKAFLLSLLTMLIGSVAAAAIGVAVSKPLQRRVVQPVADLTRQIIDIRRSRDYGTAVSGNDEMSEVRLLIDSFNTLMSDVRQRDQALKMLAYHDALTGLPNRAAMLNLLDQSTPDMTGALAVFSLRRFRSLNESFGQAIGDSILLTVAGKLRDAAGGLFLARVGSHEFAVHMPDALMRDQADSIVRDIRAQFATPIALGSRGIRIDVDAGVTMFAEQATPLADADIALQSAGLALNHAMQRATPGTAYFSEDMRDRVRTESELGQELRVALAEGGLEVHYQSVMDLKSGAITGFEALCRWCHPRKGYISPGVFIPVAEANGLIAELGRWVLNEGCRQASQWQRQTGKRRVVSVNVSAAQFLEAGFTEEVEACLKRHGLPPDLLCLELTESVFVGASAAAIRESLYVLSGLGVKLALDDFGTGYSSLGYLARLPFTTIKIDRAFVASAETTPRRKALLKSIIDMSHSVGMDVVAEGAETRAEMQMLKDLGAEKVQGFVVARPLPAAEAYVSAQAIENAIYVTSPVDRVA